MQQYGKPYDVNIQMEARRKLKSENSWYSCPIIFGTWKLLHHLEFRLNLQKKRQF